MNLGHSHCASFPPALCSHLCVFLPHLSTRCPQPLLYLSQSADFCLQLSLITSMPQWETVGCECLLTFLHCLSCLYGSVLLCFFIHQFLEWLFILPAAICCFQAWFTRIKCFWTTLSCFLLSAHHIIYNLAIYSTMKKFILNNNTVKCCNIKNRLSTQRFPVTCTQQFLTDLRILRNCCSFRGWTQEANMAKQTRQVKTQQKQDTQHNRNMLLIQIKHYNFFKTAIRQVSSNDT